MMYRLSFSITLIALSLTACQDLEKANEIENGETEPRVEESEGYYPESDDDWDEEDRLDCDELEEMAEELMEDCDSGDEEACETLRELWEVFEECTEEEWEDDWGEENDEDGGEECEQLNELAEILEEACEAGEQQACDLQLRRSSEDDNPQHQQCGCDCNR